MPRPRPLRTKEEIDAVPKDKSVTIELKPDDGVVDLGQNPFEDGPPQDAKGKGEKPAAAKEPIEVRRGQEAKGDDDAEDLKRQLEDMRRAKEESDRRIQEEIKARQEAERISAERIREASQSRVRAEDAEYEAILNAINAAEREAEKAQQDIELASATGDHKGVAEANRRLARAESRMSQLEDGKEAIERQKTEQAARAKAEADAPPRRETQRQPTAEEYIDQLPNLLPSQREWLKSHPETISDPRKNLRLQGAHVEAEDAGLRPGTKKYFDYLEQRLGYAEQVETDVEDDEPQTKAPVSAPVSRNATNPSTGRPANNKITLSPEQREMAALSGVDEITYARNLQKLDQMKRDGLIN